MDILAIVFVEGSKVSHKALSIQTGVSATHCISVKDLVKLFVTLYAYELILKDLEKIWGIVENRSNLESLAV
jgi:hypothetical protein